MTLRDYVRENVSPPKTPGAVPTYPYLAQRTEQRWDYVNIIPDGCLLATIETTVQREHALLTVWYPLQQDEVPLRRVVTMSDVSLQSVQQAVNVLVQTMTTVSRFFSYPH